MSDATIPLPEAARRLGLSPRQLRTAVRAGALPAPPEMHALAAVPESWLSTALTAVAADPAVVAAVHRQAEPDFAHFRGTSFWTKFRVRARAYRRFIAEQRQA